MGVKERRAREKQDLRQDILDAARELFVKEGFGAVSMRKIADKIEYSPTTIYLYFRDKDELFDCLSEEAFAKLIEKLDSVDDVEDPLEDLRRGLRAYVDFGLEHPDHYQITFMTADNRPPDPERTASRRETGCQAFRCLKESVARCVQTGCFREIDTNLASQIIWAGVHGVTSLLIVHPEFPWADKSDLIQGTIDTVLEGLKKNESVRYRTE